jgi:hypothetical protein
MSLSHIKGYALFSQVNECISSLHGGDGALNYFKVELL